jgi:hypothetical protein
MNTSRLSVWILGSTLLVVAPGARAVEIFSASVDLADQTIIVRGSDLDQVVQFMLGGVTVSTVNVTPDRAEIPLSTEVATIVQWRGSYRLDADGAAYVSVYFSEPVEEPGEPPPPPPPPGDPSCPCVTGWEQSGIPMDNWTWCVRYFDGTQESLSGQRDPWFISIAFDPFDLYFDPFEPGNSVSYCTLHDGTDWTVAEPIISQDQFDDCENWMWRYICI